MGYKFSFEKLEVWKNAINLSIDIYELTKKFPDHEKFGLISQMRRASVSVPSNIAEGSSRQTNRDQSWFTTIAFGSLLELLNQLIIAQKLNYINNKQLENMREKIHLISNQLNKLKKYQKNR